MPVLQEGEKTGEAAAFGASSAASHDGEVAVWFCRACAQQRSETKVEQPWLKLPDPAHLGQLKNPLSKTTSPGADSQKELWQALGMSHSLAAHGGTHCLPGRGLGLSPAGVLGRERPGL